MEKNQNPLDIYLDHCKQFALRNFRREVLNIEVYKIRKQDLYDKIFRKEFDPNKPLEEKLLEEELMKTSAKPHKVKSIG